MADGVIVIQTTLPGDWNEALVGAWCHALVESGLAACAQRSRIASTYRWDGGVESADEWRIQYKTDATRKGALIAAILDDHPYDIPMILAFSAETSADYAAWVSE
ncbi:divalent-cation tolerance protein CutA [Candidatus Poseidoniales archaeon]|nr:divalent-cation tolerance protein CutA [Candidatus Poseidoniales archaeon]